MSATPPVSAAGHDFAQPLGPPALQALAEKYRRLIDLRAARDRGPPGPRPPDPQTTATLRELSGRFPGCLRELDRLSIGDLEQRLDAVHACLGDPGRPQPEWLCWIWAYHRLLAAVLWIKSQAGKQRDLPATTRAALRSDVAALFGLSIDDGLVQDALAPPGGRLSPLVLARVATACGRSLVQLSQTLFPARTASHRPTE